MTDVYTDTRAEGADPFRAHPSENGSVVCASCGHVNAAGTDLCQGVTDGRRCKKTLRGNRIAQRTGLYVTNASLELRAIEDAGRALFEQSVADAGGPGELIARVLADHENRSLLQVNIRKLALALETHGMFDRRGRLRTAWIARLESLINTAVAIDKTLGLERRARRVQSLAEVMNGE